jgi:predicted molibdopterin-dependent oxidoreductase YjgC
MDAQNSILINGNKIDFEPGETILEIAQRHHIDIPTLCHLNRATPTGKCQVCVVEVAGADTLLTACSTPAEKGMAVLTESPRVVASRRETIRQFLTSGNHNCAVRAASGEDWTQFQLTVQGDDGSGNLCPVWGDCRLQDLAYRYQVHGDSFSTTRKKYPMEMANPFIIRDFSRCILCGRCVQACREVQVNNAIEFGYSGEETKIITPDDQPLRNSECVFCGECVQACPVGALVEKNARYSWRPWEEKKIRTTCTYCGVGCQIYLHVKGNRVVKVSGVEEVAPNYGSLCVKGRFGFDFIGSEDRLSTPLIKEDGKFRKASWDEALGLVAERLDRIRDAHGSDSIGVLTSARVTNEDNYMAMKLTRAVLKTNNIDHCARL